MKYIITIVVILSFSSCVGENVIGQRDSGVGKHKYYHCPPKP